MEGIGFCDTCFSQRFADHPTHEGRAPCVTVVSVFGSVRVIPIRVKELLKVCAFVGSTAFADTDLAQSKARNFFRYNHSLIGVVSNIVAVLAGDAVDRVVNLQPATITTRMVRQHWVRTFIRYLVSVIL